MLSVMAILARVLVVPFYKVNAGFFLFFFVLLFGIMGAREVALYHSSLMQTIVAVNVALGVAMAVVILYNYKCIAFVLNSLQKPELGFLVNLQGLPVLQQVGAFLFCQVILFMPLLLYFGLTIFIGLQHGFIVSSLGLLLFILLNCAGSAWLYFSRLNSFHKPATSLQFPVSVNYTKLPVLYPVYYLMHERKMAWLVVKLFSAGVFYLVFILNPDNFSLAYFRLIFLIAIAAHSMLVYYTVEFTEKQLAFTRNLPISRSKRLFSYFVTYLFLLLPELVWLLAQAANLMTFPELLMTFMTGLVQLLLLTSVLYLGNMQLQRYALFVCLIYLVSAVLLPSGVGVVLFIETAIAGYIFYSRYYKFETFDFK